MKEMMFYDEIRITEVPINEEITESLKYEEKLPTGVVDLLGFMGGLPLQDQIVLLCNSLTISGFSQKEIAEAIRMPYQTYRNKILAIRKTFRDLA